MQSPSGAIFTCHGLVYDVGTATCRRSVVGGEHGYAPAKYVWSSIFSFVSVEFCEHHRTVTSLGEWKHPLFLLILPDLEQCCLSLYIYLFSSYLLFEHGFTYYIFI